MRIESLINFIFILFFYIQHLLSLPPEHNPEITWPLQLLGFLQTPDFPLYEHFSTIQHLLSSPPEHNPEITRPLQLLGFLHSPDFPLYEHISLGIQHLKLLLPGHNPE